MAAPPPLQPDTESLSDLIAKLWFECMTTARAAGQVPAEAVQELIEKCRKLMSNMGCTRRDEDGVFSLIQNAIHWEWHEPTDRVFETLLDFELTEHWKERIGDDRGQTYFS